MQNPAAFAITCYLEIPYRKCNLTSDSQENVKGHIWDLAKNEKKIFLQVVGTRVTNGLIYLIRRWENQDKN